ncbi:MAG: hypothetical protein HZB50_16540 [Chloroflexi bacterium]|nr:hypothetical protein [Chloroflexota bacterium]
MNLFRKLVNPVRRLNLRYKVGLAFILPIVLVLALISRLHYIRESKNFQTQLELSTIQLGEVTLDGIRNSMYENNWDAVAASLSDITDRDTIVRAWIVDSDGRVFRSSNPSENGTLFDTSKAGCFECHQYTPDKRPLASNLMSDGNTLRVSVPIQNTTRCKTCHQDDGQHLGVLFLDATTKKIRGEVLGDIFFDLSLSLIVLVFSTFIGFALVQWLIVRRVEVIHAGLTKFGGGDFSTRILQRWKTEDELTELADKFNEIASNLEILQAQNYERERIRELAIIEERERIARELHDGVSQFLAYLSTKVGTVRLMMEQTNLGKAEINLSQIEEALNDQSIEVRSTIIGLRMSGRVEYGIISNVRDFVDRVNRLSDFPIEIIVEGDPDKLKLGAETSLQLIRIIQEAVSNIRKHAHASKATIRLAEIEGKLILEIIDDGIGFNPLQAGFERQNHYGLRIMFERAEAIAAQLNIKSTPGNGTHVIVSLNIK